MERPQLGALALLVVTSALTLITSVQTSLADLQDWLTLAGAGWPLRRANQSLAALWGRLLVPDLAADGPALPWPGTQSPREA